MNAARVRISRVRMKAGGADVRVIRNDAPRNSCTDRLRSFVRRMCERDPPEAMVCVTWRRHPSGGLATWTTWASETSELSLILLPDLARATLAADMADRSAEEHILPLLGYTMNDDPAA